MRMLRQLAAKPARLEILVYADDDDPVDYSETWKRFTARGEPSAPGQLLRGPRRGYVGLNHYYNELAKRATGRWCLLWNDDIYMATPSWDLVLDSIDQPVAVAMTESNHGRSPCTFPFFTKSFVDIIGHMSLNTHNDTWVEEVGKGAGIAVDVPITVFHAMLEDTVALEGKANIEKTSASYYAPEMLNARREDIRKIRDYLAKPSSC